MATFKDWKERRKHDLERQHNQGYSIRISERGEYLTYEDGLRSCSMNVHFDSVVTLDLRGLSTGIGMSAGSSSMLAVLARCFSFLSAESMAVDYIGSTKEEVDEIAQGLLEGKLFDDHEWSMKVLEKILRFRHRSLDFSIEDSATRPQISKISN